jgi:hypothetical protein
MAKMREHQVQWTFPSPLWSWRLEGPEQGDLRKPALLRFASDTFMEDLAALLGGRPGELHAQLARPESFRARLLGEPRDQPPPPPSVLKLYQPAHGHFNLVAANLVCRVPGMPDRSVDPARHERVSFVLRRLADDGSEMAWVDDPVGGKGWQALAAPDAGKVGQLEERLPLFPVSFAQGERRRRLLVGLIPTGSRESFQAGAGESSVTPPRDVLEREHADPRLEDAQARVIGVLAELTDPGTDPPPPSQEEDISLFLVLDLADFLMTTLPDQWKPVLEGAAPVPAASPGRALYDLLDGACAAPNATWLQAMRAVWQQKQRIALEGTTADPVLRYRLREIALNPQGRKVLSHVDLESALRKALGKYEWPQDRPVATPVPKLDPDVSTAYTLRCVFERLSCGPLQPPVVSEPSERFALASFFDTDAPARPIRIAMPVDTTLSGLRKYNRNVAIIMSNKLREQVVSVSNAKETLKGNVGQGQAFELGQICSFSIPIITICALIVLMIFIMLLNIVFWWLPLLRICLPIALPARKGS